MPDRTLTSSPALTGPTQNVVSIHAGEISVPFYWSANGQTISASDVIYLVPIPAGAIITNVNMSGWWGSSGNTEIDVGLSGETSADAIVDAEMLTSTATDAFAIRTGALPRQVTVSDDAVSRLRYLQAKVVSTASATVTGIIKGVVTYVVGRQSLT